MALNLLNVLFSAIEEQLNPLKAMARAIPLFTIQRQLKMAVSVNISSLAKSGLSWRQVETFFDAIGAEKPSSKTKNEFIRASLGNEKGNIRVREADTSYIPSGNIIESRLAKAYAYMYKAEVTYYDTWTGEYVRTYITQYDDQLRSGSDYAEVFAESYLNSHYDDRYLLANFTISNMYHNPGF